MKKTVSSLVVLICVLLLSACAYSPQQVTISPKIDSPNEPYGNGRVLRVVVEDQRTRKELGYRGGVYKETSVITVANDLTESILGAATKKLVAEGFSIDPLLMEAPELKIIIDDIRYTIPEESLTKKAILDAKLRAVASYMGKSYTGNYKTQSERPTVVVPTMKKNEAMINDLLSDTLIRLFADKKLRAFLGGVE